MSSPENKKKKGVSLATLLKNQQIFDERENQEKRKNEKNKIREEKREKYYNPKLKSKTDVKKYILKI